MRATSARSSSRGIGRRQPVHARSPALAVGVHHPARAVGVGRGPVRSAAVDVRPVRAGDREALVGPDEHHHGVRLALGHVLGRQLAPVEQPALGDPGANVGVPLHVDVLVGLGHAAGGFDVERHRQRVAGNQQRVQVARRLGLGAQLGGVERVGRHHREAAARPARGGVEPALVADALVLEEGERVVAPLVERQPVGHPAGRLADRLDHVALEPGLHLLARRADRGAFEQHQHDHGEEDDDERVARAAAGAAWGLGDRWLGHGQNWK